MDTQRASRRSRSLAFPGLAAAAAVLIGTTASPTGAQPTPGIDPPPVLLGRRVEGVRQSLLARSVVVIVKDAAGYCAAIAEWKGRERFPVLIDDGSDLIREHIARFIHAYKPSTVVRWNPEPAAADQAESDLLPFPPVADVQARRDRVIRSICRAWETETPEQLKAEWREVGLVPPGVVVMSASDPAWTAGLALAAGRGQHVIWTDDQPGQPGAVLPPARLASLERDIEAGVQATGQSWDSIGDEIEAVTLCLNIPSKILAVGAGGVEQTMALTDRLARTRSGERWGWCGQVFGDEATAAYRAMSSLFMQIDRAWMFEGYTGDFAPSYQLRPLLLLLADAPVTLAFDPARNSATDWRNAVRAGIDTDLAFVNTKGQMWNFELSPGLLWSSDVPLLRSPAIVHFTHSFSAAVVEHRSAISGRWFDNGAYAYVGAVDEPFLQAFIAGPDFGRRFLRIIGPLGCAVRYDRGPAWKVNVYADPLIVAGRPLKRIETPFADGSPIATAATLETLLKDELKSGKLEQAAADLVLLGRDKDAVRLCLAGLRAPPPQGAAATAGLARAGSLARVGVPAAFRERDIAALVTLFNALPESTRKDPYYSALIWQAARPELSSRASRELVECLAANVRELSALEDLNTITTHLRELVGKEAVRSAWERVIAFTNDEKSRSALTEGLREAMRK